VQVPTGTTGAPQRYKREPASPDARRQLRPRASSATNYIVDLELSAAQAETRAEGHLLAPRHQRRTRRKPRSSRGTEIPYQQSASSGATTISFKKAVLSLKVTPADHPPDTIISSYEDQQVILCRLTLSANRWPGPECHPHTDVDSSVSGCRQDDGQSVVHQHLRSILGVSTRTSREHG